MRYLLLTALLPLLAQVAVGAENSKYFAFVGEKISLDPVPARNGKVTFDAEFLARYRVLEPYWGTYGGKEIEFTVFDHYGTPPFSKYQHVLLYVVRHNGRYYHSKYQYSPLYKTKGGLWAGPYDADDYDHEYNKNTSIRPEIIDFQEPVVVDVSQLPAAQIEMWFPEPYYRVEGGKATAIYGNYLKELFLLKQSGVLKARGDFQ